MNKFIKPICIGALLMLTTLARADTYNDEDYVLLQGNKYPYSLGFDLSYQLIKPLNDFAQVTDNNRKGMSIYAAYRTRSPWGFELGYRWTNDKGKYFAPAPGTAIFGVTALSSNSYEGKIRLEETYIDLYGHYKFLTRYEAKLGIGVGYMRENIRFFGTSQVTDPVAVALPFIQGRTALTCRVNLGVQTLLTKQLGARALIGYETTSNIKAAGLQNGAAANMFGNTYSVAIGLYYNISGYFRQDTSV